MATVVRRMDAANALPRVPVVSVLSAVQHVNVEGGPEWLVDPPRSMQRRVWLAWQSRLTSEDEVFAVEGQVDAETLVDVIGGAVTWNAVGRGGLFVIDHDPLANWAHPCTWVFVDQKGEMTEVRHSWPPRGVRLHRLQPQVAT